MSDPETDPVEPEDVQGDWYEVELLGPTENRYVNLNLSLPQELRSWARFRKRTVSRGEADSFTSEMTVDTTPGEDGDVIAELSVHGVGPGDAEAFRELADAATRAAEYLEAEADEPEPIDPETVTDDDATQVLEVEWDLEPGEEFWDYRPKGCGRCTRYGPFHEVRYQDGRPGWQCGRCETVHVPPADEGSPASNPGGSV